MGADVDHVVGKSWGFGAVGDVSGVWILQVYAFEHAFL